MNTDHSKEFEKLKSTNISGVSMKRDKGRIICGDIKEENHENKTCDTTKLPDIIPTEKSEKKKLVFSMHTEKLTKEVSDFIKRFHKSKSEVTP